MRLLVIEFGVDCGHEIIVRFFVLRLLILLFILTMGLIAFTVKYKDHMNKDTTNR